MRQRLLSRGLVTLLALSGVTALGAEGTRSSEGWRGFQTVTVAGFTVRLSPTLLADPDLHDRIMWRLEEQLRGAVEVLPPAHREWVQSVPIWVDPVPTDEASGFATTAVYWRMGAANRLHLPSRHQAGGIALVNAPSFIRAHGQGNVMLHELAHAYDDRVLGFKDPGLLAAFNSARQQGLYTNVASSTGLTWEAYANARASEYFAELTVAYFASRTSTPHHREELRVFDPQGFRAVEQAWSVRVQGP